jgi:adenylate kinase
MTAPVMKIVGIVKVKRVLEGSPSAIWEKTKTGGGITRKFYREYFKGKKKAFAIELGDVTPLNYWVNPKTIDPDFRAPQSFQYVDTSFYATLFDDSTKKEPISRVLFFGGIHGVGKSTFCQKLQKDINITTISASELIKEERKSLFATNKDKRVKDIDNNQKILLDALKRKSFDGDFILDGHFCLLNKDREVEKIPLDVFREINPRELFLLEADPEDIKRNLMKRDLRDYDISLIKNMLREERSHAEYISNSLNKPLSIIRFQDYVNTKKAIYTSRMIYSDILDQEK